MRARHEAVSKLSKQVHLCGALAARAREAALARERRGGGLGGWFLGWMEPFRGFFMICFRVLGMNFAFLGVFLFF